jgi:DNA-binding response OmpR family regulator
MSKVLLVDDAADALEIRKQIFELHGHEVFSASTAENAREQFFVQRPDAVVLDLRLPHPEDGLALIREFRASSPSVNIVVLAGWPADLDGRAEREQVDQVLPKPARSEVLLRAVNRPSAVR